MIYEQIGIDILFDIILVSIFFVVAIALSKLIMQDIDFNVTFLIFSMLIILGNFLNVIEDYMYIIVIIMLIFMIYSFLSKSNSAGAE